MPLLERQGEVAVVDQAFASAREGTGVVLVVEDSFTYCISYPTTGCVTNVATVTLAVTAFTPIKSVTVTLPSGVTVLPYGNCSGGSSTPGALGFPDATCTTAQYTVTNSGNTSEQIDVQSSPAFPSSNSASVWQLCDPQLTPCTGSTPGVDQFETFAQGSSAGAYVTSTPTQDIAISSGSVAAGQSAQESLRITGPQSSTDQSTTFSMTVTFTAV